MSNITHQQPNKSQHNFKINTNIPYYHQRYLPKQSKQTITNCRSLIHIQSKHPSSNSTIDRLTTLINKLSDSNLLEFFERYLQKTESKFTHNFYFKQNRSLVGQVINYGQTAVCECSVTSQKYGNYGPISCQGQNASQSLIKSIKKLVLMQLVGDNKCDKQILIQCLKSKKNRPSVPIKNNHKLKIKKSPRLQTLQPHINLSNQSQQSKYMQTQIKSTNNQQQLYDQYNETLKKIKVLQMKIIQQKQINLELKNKANISNNHLNSLKQISINLPTQQNTIKSNFKTDNYKYKLRNDRQTNKSFQKNNRLSTIM